MQNLVQSLLNFAPVLVILLPLIFSGLSWMSRKLKEQGELKRLQQERERRRLEALRTGRMVEPEPEPQPQVDARAVQQEAERIAEARRREQLAELAARRQRQLAELRRQRQQALQQVSQQTPQRTGQQPGPQPGHQTGRSGGRAPANRFPPAPTQIRNVHSPGGRTMPPASVTPSAADLARHRAETQGRLRAQQEETATKQRNALAREAQLAERRETARQDHVAADVIERGEIGQAGMTAALRLHERQTRAHLPMPGQRGGTPLDANEMRRAIVLAEVLGRPVSMRSEGRTPGDGSEI